MNDANSEAHDLIAEKGTGAIDYLVDLIARTVKQEDESRTVHLDTVLQAVERLLS